MELNEKVIVVTGAGGGMGKAITEKLLTEGAQVIGMDLKEQSMAEQHHPQFTAMAVDILDEKAVAAAFLEAYEQHGKMDGLVNAIGMAQSASPIEEVSVELWHKLLDVNVTSLFLTSKEAVKYMKKNNGGSIVTIASISAVRPRPGLQAYIASKGAAESFSRALAIELAPYAIRVNTVHPGPTDTGMLGQFAATGADVETTKKQIFADSVPMGRLVAPTDIAESISYLVSDRAAMVTGAVLNVDGGRGL